MTISLSVLCPFRLPFSRAAKAKTKPQRIIPSGGVATAAHQLPSAISSTTPILLNTIEPLKLPTAISVPQLHNNGGAVAKKTTKNHPRIKYSVKQPLVGLPQTPAQSMASLVSSIASSTPIVMSNHNQKSELLNFTLSRKFGNRVAATTSIFESPDQGKVGNVFTTSNLSLLKSASAAPQIQQIYIQQPVDSKVGITNEELQTSIMSELSNYAIDEIELNPYPDAHVDSIDRDSQSSHHMYRMSAGGHDDSKFDDSQEMKFEPDGDANKNFTCRHCGKKYRWKSTLRRHENVECGGKEPAYQCPHCSYKAKQRGNLGVHIRKHHGDLPQLESRRKNRSMSNEHLDGHSMEYSVEELQVE